MYNKTLNLFTAGDSAALSQSSDYSANSSSTAQSPSASRSGFFRIHISDDDWEQLRLSLIKAAERKVEQQMQDLVLTTASPSPASSRTDSCETPKKAPRVRHSLRKPQSVFQPSIWDKEGPTTPRKARKVPRWVFMAPRRDSKGDDDEELGLD